MKSYIFDTHVHSRETSLCSEVSGPEIVRLYKAAGYAGTVVTDHYYSEFFIWMGKKSWEEKVDIFLTGYKNAYDEGKKLDFSVLPGIELRFSDSANDYLVYGIDEIFLKENEMLSDMGLNRFKKLIENRNILIYQAHPFRPGIIPADPLLLDGVEIFNGNMRYYHLNRQALNFAQENNLKMISGSDFHHPLDLAQGGIVLSDVIITPSELAQVLRDDKIIRLIKKKTTPV